jgi:hypothetical protein
MGGQEGIDMVAKLAQPVWTHCPAVGEWRQKLRLARQSSTPKQLLPKEVRYIKCKLRLALAKKSLFTQVMKIIKRILKR